MSVAAGAAVVTMLLVAFSDRFQAQGWLGAKPKLFDVVLKIDFGPAGKPNHEGTLQVEEGTTPNEVVSRIFPIRSGMSCCSYREIIEIDGIAIDPAKNKWWTCSINGKKKWVTPHKTKLKPGDVVEWKFKEDLQ